MKSNAMTAVVLAAFATFAGACTAETSEADSSSADAIQADEEEASVLLSGIPSMDSKATGVDSWRVSLVRKKNQAAPSAGLFLVAIGTHRGTEVIDVVLDERARLAMVTAEGSEPTPELQLAVADDLKDIASRLNAGHRKSTDSAADVKPKSNTTERCLRFGEESEGFFDGTILLASVGTLVTCASGFLPGCLVGLSALGTLRAARYSTLCTAAGQPLVVGDWPVSDSDRAE